MAPKETTENTYRISGIQEIIQFPERFGTFETVAKIYFFLGLHSQYLPPKMGTCQTDNLLLALDLQESCQQLLE